MKNIKLKIAVFMIAILGAFAFTPAATVGAINPLEQVCNSTSANSQVCDNQGDSTGGFISMVINTLLFIVGTLSVLMIIVAGIFYTTSGGDSGKVSKAKNTLMYAIVGLVVSFIAYAIVNWVVRAL